MRVKLKHFQENANSPLVLELGKPMYESLAGNWHTVFENQNPIVLELGCGRGAYTLGLAKAHPEWNVIGVDIKGDRIWYGAQDAKSLELTNVRFLRMRIEQIEQFFAPEEAHEIWITFPDPHPKKRSANRRMTNAVFLERYAHILRNNGLLHLKTDSVPLYEFTKGVVRRSTGFCIKKDMSDVRTLPEDHILQTVQTQYEEKYRAEGRRITYLCLQKGPQNGYIARLLGWMGAFLTNTR